LQKGRDWERWWRGKAAEDVTYVEFMGKDNVPFHTVGFPCTLFGVNTREPDDAQWKLVDRLKGFNWLNYYGGKFSTSSKRGIFMDTALELFPADYWRWYLMANAPESADADFKWEHFAATVNKDLADVLGNFVNRVLRFAQNRYEGRLPEGGAHGPEEIALFADLERRRDVLAAYFEGFEFRKALAELRAIFVLGNEYLTKAAPWTAIKTDPEQAAMTVRVGINLVHLFAHLSSAVIPDTARRIHEAVSEPPEILPWPAEPMAAFLDMLKPGDTFTTPGVLFRKIEDAEVKAFEERFRGSA
jgi:methionyl-tRNA synthetase